jgi:hypothetical protein
MSNNYNASKKTCTMHFTMMDVLTTLRYFNSVQVLTLERDGEYAAVTSGAFATANDGFCKKRCS